VRGAPGKTIWRTFGFSSKAIEAQEERDAILEAPKTPESPPPYFPDDWTAEIELYERVRAQETARQHPVASRKSPAPPRPRKRAPVKEKIPPEQSWALLIDQQEQAAYQPPTPPSSDSEYETAEEGDF
jgi:hypothetical protein